MNRNKLKNSIENHPRIFSWLSRIMLGNNRIVRKGSRGGDYLHINEAIFVKSGIKITGKGNVIEVGKMSVIKNCSITIIGSGCYIRIGNNCRFNNLNIWVEDKGSSLNIGDNCRNYGFTHIASTEGTNISVGKDCLLSNQIVIRSGDSHSIIDLATCNRINKAQDVIVEDHTWIGNDVKILKGAHIGSGSVIATGAIVTSGNYPPNSIIGGIGKVLKQGITWSPERI